MPSPLPDLHAAALARAISRGDSRSLTVLYELWFDRALDLVRFRTRRDESWCLDAVHDAFLRLIRSGRSLRALATTADLDRLMARVVHTAALDRLRRDARRAARERRRRPGDESASASDAELADLLAALRAALDAIDAEDRSLLRLRFADGRTLESAGRLAGLTAGAAHGRIRRLLARLRAALSESSHDD
jgi:RNA polymerase sigma factor (sigma-70 family)